MYLYSETVGLVGGSAYQHEHMWHAVSVRGR